MASFEGERRPSDAPLVEYGEQWVVEEEKYPSYDPQTWYPAHPGEILNDRYQLAAKVYVQMFCFFFFCWFGLNFQKCDMPWPNTYILRT